MALPEYRGTFAMDIHSHILRRILRDHHYEPELVRVVEKYLNRKRDVLDIGANVGLFTVLFAKLVSEDSRVLAVEPTPGALGLLKANVSRNAVAESVQIYEGVASNREGRHTMNVIPGKEEYSTLGAEVSHPAVKGLVKEKVDVEGKTIDQLVEIFDLHPGFIKIDAEGAEKLVLDGALDTLARERPVIMAELTDELLPNCGASSREILDLLRASGYEVCEIVDALTLRPPDTPFYGTILALP